MAGTRALLAYVTAMVVALCVSVFLLFSAASPQRMGERLSREEMRYPGTSQVLESPFDTRNTGDAGLKSLTEHLAVSFAAANGLGRRQVQAGRYTVEEYGPDGLVGQKGARWCFYASGRGEPEDIAVSLSEPGLLSCVASTPAYMKPSKLLLAIGGNYAPDMSGYPHREYTEDLLHQQLGMLGYDGRERKQAIDSLRVVTQRYLDPIDGSRTASYVLKSGSAPTAGSVYVFVVEDSKGKPYTAMLDIAAAAGR